MFDYSVSLRGLGAATDGAAAEFNPEQAPSFPKLRTYDNITNGISRTALWFEILQKVDHFHGKEKRNTKLIKSYSRLNRSIKQGRCSQDLLFLAVQLLTKQKLFGFANPSLPGFEIFNSSKISTLPSAFF